MSQTRDGTPPDGAAPFLPPRRRDKMRAGMLGSALLHGLAIALALIEWPRAEVALPPEERIVPVNLVILGERTQSPGADQTAPIPQEQAREDAATPAKDAVPVPQTPPPGARTEKSAAAATDRPSAVRPEQQAVLPGPARERRAEAAAPARQPQPSPGDELATKLKSLAKLRQPAATVPPSPRPQDGEGLSNVTAASMHGAAGVATYGVKDFIRAQVERRWNFDRAAVQGHDWSVSIHIVIDPDGTVSDAQVIDDPQHRTDAVYRDFALSARNAVWMSSPLIVPPGAYAIAKDIVVDFDPRRASR